MFGMVGAYLLTELKAALTRKLIVYSLMAAAMLLLVFAAGYGLAAIHSALAFRYGPIAASLAIAGALLALALICFALARSVARGPGSTPTAPGSRPKAYAKPANRSWAFTAASPIRAPRRKDLVALGSAALAVAGSGLALVTFVRKRRAPWSGVFSRRR
jgi:hypothetical protein